MKFRLVRSAAFIYAISLAPLAMAQQVDLPPLPTQPGGSLADTDHVKVNAFKFTGNTVVSTAELQAVVKPYLGREVTSDELEDARRKLTEVYVNKGYISSGVVLPDQDLKDNVITFNVVEGKLRRQDIEFTGIGADGKERKLWLRPSYIIDRIQAGAGKVLNLVSLKQRLELLRQDPNVKRINAELQPGATPGESHLDVRIEETRPYHLSFEFNNRRPPSVGAEQFIAHAWTTDLTGNGDSLVLDYTAFTGDFSSQKFSEVNNFTVAYAIPLNASDTTLDISFERSNTPVIEQTFRDLNIMSDTQSTAVTLRQPIVRTTTASFDSVDFGLFLTGAFRQNVTTLLGENFSFSPGALNGTSRVTAIRFGQELNLRNQQQAISVRSTFSFGLSALGSTVHGEDPPELPDSQFIDWLGQVQYVRRLFNTDNQLIFRTAVQVSNDSLLSLEQFSLGGFDTVRGYRENQLVRDQAFASTLEFHLPIPGLPKHDGISILELAPFVDIGYAKDIHPLPNDHLKFLSSIGVGMLFHPNDHVNLQVYYGYPFENTNLTSDLQDIGIHFDLLVTAF